MVMVDIRVSVARLMVDYVESGVLTAYLTINLTLVFAVSVPRATATIMTLKSPIVHQFLPASYNGRIASTNMTSDSPIC
ncbi:hypothetical protein TNCV_3336331 [Trichonephila clavipes]|nr:hypothetical protein TNCV_3336331 [Trichonephila clavipes]